MRKFLGLHKKKFFLIFLSVQILLRGFSQTKTIRNLQLDFVRTETLSSGGSTQLSGSISYENSPFAFVFTTSAPAVQTTYINSDGCFFLDEDGLFDFSESASVLKQTCTDFITWFKADLGLAEQNYKIQGCTIEEGGLVSVWWYTGAEAVPIAKIRTHSTADGRFSQLQMYDADSQLITHTILSDYKTAPGGFVYPSKIQSLAYSQNQLLATSTLLLSDVKFNQLSQPDVLGKTVASIRAKKAEISAEKAAPAREPPLQRFRSSIPSALVGTGFDFYKKFITNQDMSACPFEPSCSQYMLQAVSKYGIFGAIKGLERLKRCTSTEHKRNIYITLENGKHYDPVN